MWLAIHPDSYDVEAGQLSTRDTSLSKKDGQIQAHFEPGLESELSAMKQPFGHVRAMTRSIGKTELGSSFLSDKDAFTFYVTSLAPCTRRIFSPSRVR
jgi:hypothetical protein